MTTYTVQQMTTAIDAIMEQQADIAGLRAALREMTAERDALREDTERLTEELAKARLKTARALLQRDNARAERDAYAGIL